MKSIVLSVSHNKFFPFVTVIVSNPYFFFIISNIIMKSMPTQNHVLKTSIIILALKN